MADNPERTEEQIVAQASIMVTLGGKDYEITPLVIRDSRVWRKKVIALISPLPELFDIKTDSVEDFGKALTKLCTTMADEVADLFFEYAKGLDREEIENLASDAELRDAFGEVMKIAFPLAEALPTALAWMLQTSKVTKKGSQ